MNPPGRCVQCWERLLLDPGRELCEACLILRGTPTDLGPIEYSPAWGDSCPDCGAVLDEGMALHPDCAGLRMRRELEAQQSRDKPKGRKR